MQEHHTKHYAESEMKQIEISHEAHKALKLEAADRDMPMKSLATDILEDWLDSNRPGWNPNRKDKEGEGDQEGEVGLNGQI